MKLYHLLNNSGPFSWLANKSIESRLTSILGKITPYLNKEDKILDIGSGTGHTDHALLARGYKKIICLDRNDLNIFADTKPVLYDGGKLPFKDNSFDVAMILTVLHHTTDPEKIIREASRVAKRLVIMEDTYQHAWQKTATHWMDSIGNLQFADHPHTNKTDEEWQKLFAKNHLKLIGKHKGRFYLIFESTTFHLVKTQ